MNTPIWNIMHINISITTIRTFIIPTIFNRQLFVIVSENFHRGYILHQASAEVNSFLIAAHILTNLIVSQQFDLFCVIWNEDVKHHIIFNPKVAEK